MTSFSESDIGEIGGEEELEGAERRTGRVGIENGMGPGDADSYPLSKLGVTGELEGVLRRTYVEIGMSAGKSQDESLLVTLWRYRRDDRGGNVNDCKEWTMRS